MSEIRSIETRFQKTGNTLTGYASVFNSPTTITERGKTFVERIAPGAFKRALQEKQDVIANYQHDDSRMLGRSTSGTLRMKEDKHGLYIEVDLPEAETVVRELLGRGDLNGASFRFDITKEEWVDGVRVIQDVDLQDVSVVIHPAYSATSVSLRSKDAWRMRNALLRKTLPAD